MDICVYITDLLCCTPETNTTLEINYNLIIVYKILLFNVKGQERSFISELQQCTYFQSMANLKLTTFFPHKL